jgi:hypothetical protein
MFESFSEMKLIRAGASGSLKPLLKITYSLLIVSANDMFKNIQPFASNRMEALSRIGINI